MRLNRGVKICSSLGRCVVPSQDTTSFGVGTSQLRLGAKRVRAHPWQQPHRLTPALAPLLTPYPCDPCLCVTLQMGRGGGMPPGMDMSALAGMAGMAGLGGPEGEGDDDGENGRGQGVVCQLSLGLSTKSQDSHAWRGRQHRSWLMGVAWPSRLLHPADMQSPSSPHPLLAAADVPDLVDNFEEVAK